MKKPTKNIPSTPGRPSDEQALPPQPPFTVKTPEGPVLVKWIQKEMTRVGYRKEVHIRLVSDSKTIVIRCLPGACIRKRYGRHLSEEIDIPDKDGINRKCMSYHPAERVALVKHYNPELNPPIEVNAPELPPPDEDNDVDIDIIDHITQLTLASDGKKPNSTPSGMTLLYGNMLMPCLGYFHDNRTPEEIDFVNRLLLTRNPPEAVEENTTPPESQYVFRRSGDDGDYWEIVFEGRKIAPVRHLVGMTYLAAVLNRHDKEISAQDLYELANPPPPRTIASPSNTEQYEAGEIVASHGTGGSIQKVLDERAIREIKERCGELTELLENPALSRGESLKFENELSLLKKNLKHSRVPETSGGATIEDKQHKKGRQAVSAAITRAIERLPDPRLTAHLAKTLKKGSTFSYLGGLRWNM